MRSLDEIAKYIKRDQTGSLKLPNETLLDAQMSDKLNLVSTKSDAYTKTRNTLSSIIKPGEDLIDQAELTKLRKNYKYDYLVMFDIKRYF